MSDTTVIHTSGWEDRSGKAAAVFERRERRLIA
jgi:hypothetical protein